MIISWGGGVNSTAIIALHLLGELKGKPEIVFADTGCEYPETYAYINTVGNMLIRKDWKVKVLRPWVNPEYYSPQVVRNETVYKYCFNAKTIPLRRWKICTDKFKVKPLKRYANGRKRLVGICKDEWHRAFMDDTTQIFPLKDYTRDGCAWLVGKAGLPIPHKTGCWCCYALKKQEWIDMYDNRPELWKECVELESNSKTKYRTGITLEEQIKKWQS